MEFTDVVRTTAAIRQFTDDPLPDDVLERILDNARFAPSGGNRQGTRLVVVRDRETREKLADLSVTGWRRYIAQKRIGENPWNPLHRTAVTEEDLATVDVPRASPLVDAAVVVVVCVDLGVVAALDQHLDRIGVVPGASVYPFAWNILLSARNEGFGGVLTTMAIAEEPKIKELLAIPDDYAVAAILPLGKPAHQPTRLTRKPVSEIATRERFDGAPF
ncbi:nitroreductase family protein [Mycolicibacterium goodii]|uniref:Nitroreductase family protein n=1 Tax=Mycolicibacterium goodii TaxID=134601 RepID=A0ABS6HMZ3_MYCGD|nr:nitroreductase family protein [Mycolicibacterium goodii]MBU8812391.1 nitroreductase family protein [Mycolicibacterium goodii]MBU8823300.1 nitroreductase family protein [Mycolicibacterium goodii]MBU8832501.1 nitroreductase family protein [Mycolicibacterium goodii]MBU8835652.1 nitroreductase family protein [Mycolicibacterium goodii]PJK20709.1 nitroreductase [Mycolicibacterium goodii]